MNKPAEPSAVAASAQHVTTGIKQKMTPSEAFVETMAVNGVTNVFGIVGSAFMDALDLFPSAGIRFIPTVHEQGAAHMAMRACPASTACASRRTARASPTS